MFKSIILTIVMMLISASVFAGEIDDRMYISVTLEENPVMLYISYCIQVPDETNVPSHFYKMMSRRVIEEQFGASRKLENSKGIFHEVEKNLESRGLKFNLVALGFDN